MKQLVFDADPRDVLIYDPDASPPKSVHGGESFSVTDDRALEFLTNPAIPIKEAENKLEALSRPELEALASDAGVKDPANKTVYPNKDSLIAALENPPDNHPSQGEAV